MKPHEIRQAEQAVENFTSGDAFGKNTKYLEDGETIQIRIRDTLRVQFKITEDGEKEIVQIFTKGNHKSHR